MLAPQHRPNLIFAAEVLLAVAAIWILGIPAGWTRLAAWTGAAFLLVLVLWTIAVAVELGILFVVSWDDSRHLILASLRAGAQAVWFVPALVLLSLRSPAARITGLALVANTTRMLLSRHTRKSHVTSSPPSRRRYRFLGQSIVRGSGFGRETIPIILGAIALQIALVAVWTDQPLVAAALTLAAFAVWTWTAIRVGATVRDRPVRSTHWPLSIVLTLLLATLLSTLPMEVQSQLDGDSPPATVFENLEGIWRNLQEPPVPKTKVHAKNATAAKPGQSAKSLQAGGVELVPGVIVRPETPTQRRAMLLYTPPSMIAGTPKVDRETKFPFTGEYRVFPASSARRRHDWAIEAGTLLENLYESAGGGELETIAEQDIHPPMDFSTCGRVIVQVEQKEGPFTASLYLLAGSVPIEAGTEIAGLQRGMEQLEFDLPGGLGRVNGIRLAFHRIARQGRLSMKVAVREFTFLPRGQ